LSEVFKHQRDAFDASHAGPEWKKIGKNLGRRISYKIAFILSPLQINSALAGVVERLTVEADEKYRDIEFPEM